MNVFRYELRQYRRGLLGWAVGLSAFVCLYMPFMPAFLDEAASMKEFFLSLGPAVLGAMGINVDLFFGTLGFYGFLFIFINLLGAIQASAIGLNIISKETLMKTADFLLTKPESRGNIFLEKLLAAVFSLAVTELAFYATSAVAMRLATGSGLAVRPFVLITLTLTYTQLIFLAVGMFAATAVGKIKSVTPVAVGISLGAFIIGMMSNMTGSEVLRWFSPLRWFDTNQILKDGGYEPKFFIFNFAASAVLLAGAYMVYRKKNIAAV